MLYTKENKTSLLLKTSLSIIRTRLIRYIKKKASTKSIKKTTFRKALKDKTFKKALKDKTFKKAIVIITRQGKRNAIYIRKQAASLLSIS